MALVLTTISSAYASGVGQSNVIGTTGSPSFFVGTDIAGILNANGVYGLGYTGTRSIIANIEAGTVYAAHEVFTGKTITNFFIPGSWPAPAGFGGHLGDIDRHATWVGHSLVGNGNNVYKRGIAYGATLWSGAIANGFGGGGGYNGSFTWTDDHIPMYAYQTAMQTGIGGKTADVINSSWGFTLPSGNDPFVRAIDNVIEKSHKITMFSSGNSGPVDNSVGGIAAGFNAISVGATGPVTNGYTVISSFSSRGLNDYYDPNTGNTVSKVRARVDMVAPGDSLTLAGYSGKTGGNWSGTGTASPTGYFGGVGGTSFSSPFTAASAALLVDVAKAKGATDNSYLNANDQRVMKTILMTGANHLAGWSNNSSVVGGALVTSQALDAAQGAGQVDVGSSYNILTQGTHDVAGTSGGNVRAIGWDAGTVAKNGQNDYVTDYMAAGSTLTVSLDWFVHSTDPTYNPTDTVQSSFLAFNDLSLSVYSMTGNVVGGLIAQSDAKYLNTEYVSFALPNLLGHYDIRVKWMGQNYDFSQGGWQSENYGLAWKGTQAVPEPSTMVGLTLAGLAMLKRRKKA